MALYDHTATQLIFNTSPDRFVMVNIKPCVRGLRVYAGPKKDIEFKHVMCINNEYYQVKTDYSSMVIVFDISKCKLIDTDFHFAYPLSTYNRIIAIGDSIHIRHTAAKGTILNHFFRWILERRRPI